MIVFDNWYQRAKQDAYLGIPIGDRIVSVLFFFASVFALLYLINHQIQNTGFYSEKFGIIEAVFLYGFWSVWIITAGLEGILGARLWSRLFDALGGILVAAIASLWLFIVFPFDFSYFTVLMPETLRWSLAWVNNDVARIIFFIAATLHVCAVFYAPFAYKLLKFKLPPA